MEDDKYFKELLDKIPENISQLVSTQMDIAVIIGDRLKELNISKEKVANDFNISIDKLNRILAGNEDLRLSEIIDFQIYLNENIIIINQERFKNEKN